MPYSRADLAKGLAVIVMEQRCWHGLRRDAVVLSWLLIGWL